MGLFTSRTKKENLSHIDTLYTLACMDGKVDEAEVGFILNMAKHMGVSEKEATKRMLQDPKPIVVPEEESTIARNLNNLLMLSFIDGEFHVKEVKYAARLAILYNVNPEMLFDFLIRALKDLKGNEHLGGPSDEELDNFLPEFEKLYESEEVQEAIQSQLKHSNKRM